VLNVLDFDSEHFTAHPNCPNCGSGRLTPLMYVQSRGVPHGAEGHKVVYDYKRIALCDDCGCALLEVHSHDCWSLDEPWDMYWWYVFRPADVGLLRQWLGTCPAPLDAGCECGVHQRLRELLKPIFGGIRHAENPARLVAFRWLEIGTGGDAGEWRIAMPEDD
jgi:hypothetical protein